MSPQTRTPRQPPGEHLVTLTVRVPKELCEAIWAQAANEERSVSQMARVLIERAFAMGAGEHGL